MPESVFGARRSVNTVSRTNTWQGKCGGAESIAASTAETADSLWAKAIGGTAAGGVLIWVLLSSNSPVWPKRSAGGITGHVARQGSCQALSLASWHPGTGRLIGCSAHEQCRSDESLWIPLKEA